MKKIFFAFTLLAGMSFMACDPVEDSFDAPANVSAEDFNVTAKTILVKDAETGEEYAVGVVENHSPIPSTIEYVVPDYGDGSTIAGVKNGTSVILRTEGVNTFIFTGFNPDGSFVKSSVTCECPVGKRKKVLPNLETTVWEPITFDEDGSIHYPVLADWGTPEARFSDAEGLMGKWTAAQYDALIKDKNVFIEFNKPWSGEWMICTGWWSDQQVLNNDGKQIVSFYMNPDFIDHCKSEDLAFIGRGLQTPDVRFVRMYTLMEL